MTQDKFYITTSIAYTNAPSHIGFALELVQADVLARHNNLQAKDVQFLTGVDEHGLKVQQAAKEEGLPPETFSAQITEGYQELTKVLNISNNDFIRTTDTIRHRPAVYKVWQKLKENGDIYKKPYKGYYCVGCESFITKKDLVDGKCYIHKDVPQLVEEENYFFRLSKYQEKLKEIIGKGKIRIIPEERKNETLQFINQGLEDISFSRSIKNLKWGFPVPGDKEQIIYVWCDALTNYLSALGYAKDSKDFQRFWPADIHCIGKDILRFHTIFWPAMLLSLGLPLPKIVFVHGFITVDGQKMSKSLGNIVDPFELVKSYGTDAVRYFLLREIPATKDGDFTYQKFEERYNADLAKGLGNLVARVFTMVEKYCDNRVPAIDRDPDSHPLRVNEKIHNWKEAWKDIDDNVSVFQFNKALSSIWEFISEADRYIEENKPWDLAKEGKTEELSWVLYGLLDAIHQLAWQIYIFIPETSLKIARALNIGKLLVKNPQNKDSWTNIKPGTKIKKLEPLFPRIG